MASVRLPAQTAEPAAETETYKVNSLRVRFVGTSNVSEQVVRANMQIKEGTSVDEVIIDRDIRTLYKTGLFEFIEVKRENLPGSLVNLVVEVTPKYRVLTVRFQGNKRIKTSRLENEVQTKDNASLDERQVKEDAEALRTYYQKKGYNQVQVSYSVERNRETGFGSVLFKIREGDAVKIDDIRFVGNAHFKAKALRKVMETKRHWMFSWLTSSGRFKDDTFEDDLDKLRDFYREQGYLDIEIAPESVRYDYPKPGKLLLTITVNEGRRYYIGAISLKGNKLYPETLLKRILRQKTGKVFAPSLLDKDTERLEDFYGRDGYLDTRVALNRKPNVATGNIDIEYEVHESEKFNVESIHIEGNTKSRSTVILRELTLGPGDVFNTVRMKISKYRLENTRFFDEVNLSPEETNIPGRRNLKVVVKEARTGNLSFGAGYSSLERATFFVELAQGNFDFRSPRSFFQGDGQKFRIRLQYGSSSSEMVMSFEEPWFMQKQLAVGFELFRTSSDYFSDYYEEIRTGGEIYVRKHLIELIEARYSYSYQVIDITDVTSSAPTAVQEWAGTTAISKVGLQLLRDTRDKIISTTRGNRSELNFAVAGARRWRHQLLQHGVSRRPVLPVFETQQQTLALLGRVGVMNEFGNKRDASGDPVEIPFYEKFFLGGPYTLRGFEYRDVGPKDAYNEPLGGRTYGFFSAEYSLDIVSPIRFAVFYDAGFLNVDAYDFDPSSYNDNFGVGIRLFVMGTPLSLDYGIPLRCDKVNDKGGQFNFSFGTRF
jgi:outer membrane protein insertion porin family